MSPSEFRAACVKLFGEKTGQTRMAEALEVDPSSVRRWISGAIPIPGPVKAAVRCFLNRQRAEKRKSLDFGKNKP